MIEAEEPIPQGLKALRSLASMSELKLRPPVLYLSDSF